MKKIISSLIFLSFWLYSCDNGDSNESTSDNNSNNYVPIEATDLVRFETEHFAGSGNCAECHSNLRDSSGNDVSIDRDWRSTMMANASKDPFWQAKVHSEVLRNPDYKSVIEEKCATCHMPIARTQAKFDGKEVKIFDGGFLDKNNRYHKLAMDGVSCTLCHQIQNDGKLGTKESFSGNYTIDENTPKPDRQIFGPYQNPLTMPMRMMVGFTPTYSPHIESSELCATCHTLYTPTVDDNGNIVGEIPEQTPYLEWENSKFGDGGSDDLSCQDCHMPVADGGVKISNRPMVLPERQPFHKHYFVGGNVYMLEILKKYLYEIGATATEGQFNRTIERTKDMLQQKTAEISIGTVSLNGSTLEIPVKIINKSGHKLPTGYPSRRVWIHIKVEDSNGNVIFESGKITEDGKIIGNDADENEAAFEPHYDIITSEDQVQIYEAIMEDVNGNVTYTLLKGADYIKDNRLLPEGFDKSSVPSDITVKGNAYSDSNFIGGEDSILYRVDVSGYSSPYKIKVELLYQSIAYRFIQDLFKDSDKSIYVSKFKNYYSTVPNTGVVIDSAEITY